MTTAVALAIIRARRFATATQSFAFVLATAGMFFSRGASPLSAARVLAVFALTFAFVEATAQMDIGLS